MRNTLFLGILGLLLLFGCAAPPETPPTEPLLEEEPAAPPPNVSVEEPIQVSGDENLQEIKVKATKTNGEWQFPLQTYDGEFESVGLHSDSFIKLDKNHIAFLDEGEAIWLTPMIKDEKGVLFNAIHSNEIETCNASTLKILGKTYEVSTLKNGSSFENDDKWKVALDIQDDCLKRVIIYMGGYFYGIGEDVQVSIFRNDNTLLLQFMDLESQPQLRLIATKPPE